MWGIPATIEGSNYSWKITTGLHGLGHVCARHQDGSKYDCLYSTQSTEWHVIKADAYYTCLRTKDRDHQGEFQRTARSGS